MNGYKMTADSYRTLRGNSKLDQKDIESNIKVLDFLATCTQEDIYSYSPKSNGAKDYNGIVDEIIERTGGKN